MGEHPYSDYHTRRRALGEIASMIEERDRQEKALYAFFEDIDLSNARTAVETAWIEIGPAKIPGIRVKLRDGTRFDLHISQIEQR